MKIRYNHSRYFRFQGISRELKLASLAGHENAQ